LGRGRSGRGGRSSALVKANSPSQLTLQENPKRLKRYFTKIIKEQIHFVDVELFYDDGKLIITSGIEGSVDLSIDEREGEHNKMGRQSDLIIERLVNDSYIEVVTDLHDSVTWEIIQQEFYAQSKLALEELSKLDAKGTELNIAALGPTLPIVFYLGSQGVPVELPTLRKGAHTFMYVNDYSEAYCKYFPSMIKKLHAEGHLGPLCGEQGLPVILYSDPEGQQTHILTAERSD